MQLTSTTIRNDIVLNLSVYLPVLKENLEAQLTALETFQVQGDAFMFQITTKGYTILVDKLLHMLRTYLDTAIKDFLSTVDEILELMFEYDQGFDEFVANSASAMAEIASCIEKIEGLKIQHSRTLENLSNTATEINEYVQRYRIGEAPRSSNHTSTTVGLGVAGIVTTTALVFLSPIYVFVTAGMAVGLYDIATAHVADSKQRAEIKARWIAAETCSDDDKNFTQEGSRQLLDKRHTQRCCDDNEAVASHTNEDYTPQTYQCAQRQAENVISHCRDIQWLSSRVVHLHGAVTARLSSPPRTSTLLA